MASASHLIAVLLFWACIGISWAMLNENLVEKLPTMFSTAITQDPSTWEIMLFLWRVGIIALAIGSAIALLGQKSISGVITAGALIFSSMFMLIFLWAAFWEVTNVTIPTSFAQGFNTSTKAKENLQIYDAAFQVLMFGLVLCAFMLGGMARISRGRKMPRTYKPSFGKPILTLTQKGITPKGVYRVRDRRVKGETKYDRLSDIQRGIGEGTLRVGSGGTRGISREEQAALPYRDVIYAKAPEQKRVIRMPPKGRSRYYDKPEPY